MKIGTTIYLHGILSLLVLIFISTTCINAQQGNFWAFGLHGGLNFNYQPPQVFRSSMKYDSLVFNDDIASNSSSISDCQGNLLFYASGCVIWNKNHNIMQNGNMNNCYYGAGCKFGLGINGNLSSISFIVRKPNTQNQYYYFNSVVDHNCYSGIYYSVVDMTLDNGLGGVVSGQKEIPINPNASSCMEVIPHANGTDYWLIVAPNNTQFNAYPVTSSGIGSPVISNNVAANNQLGYFAASHNGNYLIATDIESSVSPHAGILYNFNQSTGQITTNRGLAQHSQISPRSIFNAEFSPNDSLMYLLYADKRTLHPMKLPTSIIQRPVDPASGSQKVIGYPVKWNGIGLNLAPNQKIYTSIWGDSLMGVIHHPNKVGQACGYQPNALNIGPALAGENLPNQYFPVHRTEFHIASACSDTTQFINTSDSSHYTGFKWYFGDGDIATGYHASHVYDTAGAYYVQLAAYDTCGNTTWKTDTIEIYQPVEAGFTIDSVTYQCREASFHITDTASSNATSRQYKARHVDWPSGINAVQSNQQNPVIPVDTSGAFKITQTASSPNCSDQQLKHDTATLAPKPNAAFSISDTMGCPPLQVSFQNQSTNAQQYTWHTDSQIFNGPQLSHTYPDTGFYDVTLIAQNSQGCKDTLHKPKAIYGTPLPKAIADTPFAKVCPKEAGQFQNQSKNATSVKWHFGDQISSTNANPAHAYDTSGFYDIMLTASNGHCTDTTTYDSLVQVLPRPEPGFELQYQKACTPLQVQLQSEATGNIDSMVYHFGNGQTAHQPNPSVTYNREDIYMIRQTVHAPGKCNAADSLELEVYQDPNAQFSISDTSVFCHDKAFEFKNASAPQNPPLGEGLLYDWMFQKFGDTIAFDTTKNLVEHYSKPGNYPVTLVTTNGLCQDSLQKLLKVRLRQKPNPAFEADSLEQCLPAKITFKNQSQHFDSLAWHFGDGNSSNQPNPKHQYTQPGTYDVTLEAFSDEGCHEVLEKEQFITLKEPVEAGFDYTPKTGCSPLQVTFTNESKPPDQNQSLTWYLPNNTIKTRNTIRQTFTDRQNEYEVKLLANNGICKDSITQTVQIRDFGTDGVNPEMEVVTVKKDSFTQIKWKELPVATQYRLQKQMNDGNWQTIAKTSELQFKDTGVNPDQASYTYRIQGIDSCRNLSQNSNNGKSILLQGQPVENSAKARLNWTPYQEWQSGIQHYQIERLDEENEFEVIGSTNDQAYTDPNFFKENKKRQTYRITAVKAGDAIQSKSNELTLEYPSLLYVPNAFSPNEDGINETFKVKATNLKQFSLKIYNPWGTKVFETRHPEKVWDGNFKGRKAPTGDYIYLITATTEKGKWLNRNGTLKLLR